MPASATRNVVATRAPRRVSGPGPPFMRRWCHIATQGENGDRPLARRRPEYQDGRAFPRRDPTRRFSPRVESSAMKFVFSFGDGKAEGDPTRRDLLGGKGAGLAEMTSLGLPVPPGFTISTEACRAFTGAPPPPPHPPPHAPH